MMQSASRSISIAQSLRHFIPIEPRGGNRIVRMLGTLLCLLLPITLFAEAPASFGNEFRLNTTMLNSQEACSTDAARIAAMGRGPRAVVLLDLNNDGHLDAATANDGGGGGTGSSENDGITVRFGSGDGSFATLRSYTPNGAAPVAIAGGDLNGDGAPDLVTANINGSTLSFMLNNGDGSFGPSVALRAGDSAVSVIDWNKDGFNDIVAASYWNSTAVISLGNNNGTFTAARSYSVGTNPFGIATGDFNRDGVLDLATANHNDNTVTVLLFADSTSVAQTITLAAGSNPYGISATDLNSDGYLDIAVSNAGSHNLYIFKGNGSGSFAPPDVLPAGTGPRNLVIADTDGNASLVIVVANAEDSTITLLRQQSDGTFGAAMSLAAGTMTFGIAVADLDADGFADVVTGNRTSNDMWTFLGGCHDLSVRASGPLTRTAGSPGVASVVATVGGGTEQAGGLAVTATSIPAELTVSNIANTKGAIVANVGATCSATLGANTISLEVRDTQGNSASTTMIAHVLPNEQPTLGTYNDTVAPGSSFQVSPNAAPSDNGTVTLSASASSGFSGSVAVNSSTGVVSLSNVNPGTHTFTVIATDNCAAQTTRTFVVTEQQSAGCMTFDAPIVYPMASGPRDVLLSDLNGDGKVDVATPNDGASGITVRLGNGDGTFQAVAAYASRGSAPVALAAGDLNGDAAPDLISADINGVTLSVFLNTGVGTFHPATALRVGDSAVRILDWNGDGFTDVVAASYWNSIATISFGAGNGTFAAPRMYAVGVNPFGITAADFNGDGRLDLATANHGGHTVTVHLFADPLTVERTVTLPAGTNPYGIRSADLNADGLMDLVVSNATSNDVYVFAGDGAGGFGPSRRYAAGQSPRNLDVADMNGDSLVDLVIANTEGSAFTVLTQNSDESFSTAVSVVSGSFAFGIAAADLNGDGMTDVVTGNRSSNNSSVFLGSCPINAAPLAANDSYNATAGTTLTVAAPGVLQNDVDPDGNTLSVNPLTGLSARGAAVTLNADGSFTYTPSASLTGADSFEYAINDGNGGTATGLVNIDVKPACSTPAARITASGPLTFCAGGAVTLTAEGGGTYLWSNGATTPSILVTQPGSYSVTTTVDGGCSFTSAPVVVTTPAIPLPEITPSGPTAFCSGGDVTLTSSPADSYLWSDGSRMQSTRVTEGGAYTVTASLDSRMELIASIPIPGMPAPDNQAIPSAVVTDASGGKAYIVYSHNGAPPQAYVLVLDTRSNQVLTTIPLGGRGGRAALNRITQKLYVAGGEDGIAVVDAASNTLLKYLNFGGRASGIAVNEATNRVYVTRDLSSQLWIVDGDTEALVQTVTLSITDPGEVAVNSNTNRVYITQNRGSFPLLVVDGNTNLEIKQITDGTALTMEVDEINDRLFVGSVDGSAVVRVYDRDEELLHTIPQFGGGTEFVRGLAYDGERDILYRSRLRSGEIESIDGNSWALLDKVSTGSNRLYFLAVDAAANRIIALERDSFEGTRVDGRVHIVDGTFLCSATSAPESVTVHPDPVLDAGDDRTTVEGSEITLTPSSSEPTTIIWGDGTTSTSLTHVYVENGTYLVSIVATNSDGCSASDELVIRVLNADPIVSTINAPSTPQPVNTTVNASASFSDPGLTDTHSGTWSWGDGTSSPAAVAAGAGGGAVTGTHVYTSAGVYTVTLTVTDDDGGTATAVHQFVVIYDTNAGFVTGGGWITSPAGAYAADPSLTGKATFGFVSKYKNGSHVPEGNTQFKFHAADFEFGSTEYEWLVIAGAKAQYKGIGTINGSGSYRFMLTAIDGDLLGGAKPDTFRLRVWDDNGVAYDNQMNAPDDAEPTTALGGGSIVIHKK